MLSVAARENVLSVVMAGKVASSDWPKRTLLCSDWLIAVILTLLFFVDELLTLIGKGVGYDWIALGQQLEFTDSELQEISDRQ